MTSLGLLGCALQYISDSFILANTEDALPNVLDFTVFTLTKCKSCLQHAWLLFYSTDSSKLRYSFYCQFCQSTSRKLETVFAKHQT